MHVNWIFLLAVIGSITGIAGLGWNIYLKLSAGPKVLVKVWSGMIMMPTPPGNPSYIRITVRNTGTTATKLTTLGFHVYQSGRSAKKRKPDKSFVVLEVLGTKLPYKLEVGDEWDGYVQEDLALKTLTEQELFG
jgi:hypothetical protein